MAFSCPFENNSTIKKTVGIEKNWDEVIPIPPYLKSAKYVTKKYILLLSFVSPYHLIGIRLLMSLFLPTILIGILSIIFVTQVEDYGHWIPQDPGGKKRESHRILQKSIGNSRNWKQYSDRKFFGFFSVDSNQFPVLSGRNRQEIIGKNPKNFRWKYCFHISAISGAFLPEPVRNFRSGYLLSHQANIALLQLFIDSLFNRNYS